MNFGNKLIELRKQNKMTQDEVGEKLGVARQTVSNWELNQTKPDMEQLKGISKIYKISLDELVDNDIKEVLTEKVSNVEKLAGFILMLLKGAIIFGLLFIVLIVISVIIFKTHKSTSSVTTVDTLSCTLENKYYNIEFESKDNKLIEIDGLNELTNNIDLNKYQSSTQILNNVVNYFETNGGSCE